MEENKIEEGKTEDKNSIAGEIKKEEQFIADKKGGVKLSEEELLRIRKEKLVKLLKHDAYFSSFIVLAIISIIWGISELGLEGLFSSLFKLSFISELHLPIWLFILSIVSALFAYHKKHNLMFYPLLTWIVVMAVRIRTRNLPLLRDITTGTWTLGPDLDPFLFLRWAEYIVKNGTLFAIDTMRYVPLGYDIKGELLLHPYMMAWFHKIAVFFGSESINYSAVIYPVFMFALTIIAFFLFTRKIFVNKLGNKEASIIALISSFFLSVIPVLLPRTIAGIPEKESAAFLFLFLAFYFFLSAWEAKKLRNGIILAILAGASTAGMALIWGGSIFIFLTIAPLSLIVFFLGKIDKEKFYLYTTWILVSFAFMYPFSTRYTIENLLSSYDTGFAAVVLFIIGFHIFIFEPYLKRYFISGRFKKIPARVISVVIAFILVSIGASLVFGFSFIPSQINNIIGNVVAPSSTRLLLTVAENRQPYFTEWSGSFGPVYRGIPLLFWLFFIGSIYLLYKITSNILMKKERLVLSISYSIFLFSLVFSRYSPESTFNGTNTISLFVYLGGPILFIVCFGYYYYMYHKKGEEHKFNNLEMGFALLLIFFFLSILAARSAVRTIMVLVPSASIIVGYLGIAIFNDAKKIKDNILKIISLVFIGFIFIATIYSGWQYFNIISAESGGYAPSIYTQQWQKAMAWVRENPPKNSVFGHWWDYGYWLQSIGERATVLDGGNAISYWNHMMGRYALTGANNSEALEFLYAHNTTHFLIDSTDIGKYTAFSSIGSDPGYDRRSWLPIFSKDERQIQETKNSTIYLYTGGTPLDDDILYENNGTQVFLPGGNAGLGAILVEEDSTGRLVNQPRGIFVYQGRQYTLPFRYAFSNGEFFDFNSGIESGVFLFHRIDQENGQIKIVKEGALIYLSKRTVKSQLARLYLYNEDNLNFRLVHSEDDFFVAQAKANFPEIGEFVYYSGLRGPIKIWEINYPKDIKSKDKYLQIDYPKEIA